MKAGFVASEASEMLDCCDSEASPYFIPNAENSVQHENNFHA
jgi:hypothetical protein